jgi:sulfopyruvate decarboxylase alpha subunit
MRALQFLELLEKNQFDFFTGVPCSYVKPLIAVLNERRNENHTFHIPAVREDIAVGLAAGAYLAGKSPVVYMQNSGLGYSLEAVASLHLIYRFPTLFLVTYRGPNDPGMEEHQIMGLHTEEILQTFKIKYSLLTEAGPASSIKEIKEYLLQEQLPYVLLVTKGALI